MDDGFLRFCLAGMIGLSMLSSVNPQTSAFNYGQQGRDWGGLCQKSDLQSPINILEYQSTCDVSHTFKFQVRNDSAPFDVQLDPSGFKIYSYFVDFFLRDSDGTFIGFDSQFMKLKSPAEHQINGETYDLELQVTGQLKAGYSSRITQATFCVLFRQLSDKPRVFSDDPVYETSKMFDFLDLGTLGLRVSEFPKQFAAEAANPVYYFYEGSLTEPDCQPHLWVIFTNYLYLTRNDYEKVKGFLFATPALKGLDSNARTLQIKGDRLVIRGGVDCSTYFGYVVAFVLLFIFMIFFVFKLL